MAPQKLQVREIVAVILFSGIILGISCMSFYNNSSSGSSSIVSISQDTIVVEVVGAVKYPGKYTVAKHTAIPHLIDRSQPLENAVLYSNLKINKNAKGELVLAIPFAESILIHISGAVSEPGWKNLPQETRIYDLANHITFLENHDKKFLKRKRHLRNGEFLVIP